jgi:hypothetical protein
MPYSTPSNWREDYRTVVDGWRSKSDGVIISADVDGLVSCSLLALSGTVRVIGAYTTTHLLLFDGARREDAQKALWLDHDISQRGIRCIGQHLVHHQSTNTLPLREPESFNPNVWLNQSWRDSFKGRSGKKRDKFPFGTCHFVAVAEGVDLGAECSEFAALLAHADGTWRTVVDYQANADIWYEQMFAGDVFLRHLRDEWHKSAEHLEVHKSVVERLVEAGVARTQSRAKIAALLPDHLRELTGKQSIQYKSQNPQKYIQSIRNVMDYISTVVGGKVQVGTRITETISGTVETPYPDKISDFDQFMLENKIFSHAFTDLRTLRYTTGISI